MKNKKMNWTHFMDMHSGGSQKLEWAHIFIEAPENEATIIFQNRFDRNPHRVTCTCCGDDYALSEAESLEQATAYNRRCRYAYFKDGKELNEDEKRKSYGKAGVVGKYVEEADKRYGETHIPLEKYLRQKDVLVIRKGEIKPDERKGELHEEGYVWMG